MPTIAASLGATTVTITSVSGAATIFAVSIAGVEKIAGSFAVPLEVSPGLPPTPPAPAPPAAPPPPPAAPAAPALTPQQLSDLQGRFGTASVQWTNFCGAAAAAVVNGDIQITFQAAAPYIVGVVARLRFASTAGGGTVAFVVRITANPTLALHCEDLLLELPEVPFPGLTFAGLAPLPLPVPGAAPVALPFLPDLAINFAYTIGGVPEPAPLIAFGLAGGLPTAALTNAAGAPIDLTTTLTYNGAAVGGITLPGLSFIGAKLTFSAAAATLPPAQPLVFAKQPVQIFGAIAVACKGHLSLDLSEAAGIAPKLAIRLDLDSLALTANDDVGPLIELSGTVFMTPARIWVENAALLTPAAVQLQSLGRGQAERLAGGMSRLVFSAASALGTALLDALARIGASAGRALLATPGAGAALTGIAATVDRVLRGIAAAATAVPMNAEILFTAAPFRLRQIRISPLSFTGNKCTGPLFGLALDASWQFGLLIDFATVPGVYFCALPVPGGTHFCTFDIGLWLGGETTTAALPTDGTAAPALKIALDLKDDNARDLIILAGYGGGQAHFLQTCFGPLRPVALSSGGSVLVQPEGFAFTPIAALQSVAMTAPGTPALPLLGQGGGSGISLTLDSGIDATLAGRTISATLMLHLALETLSLDLPLAVTLDLDDFRLDVRGGTIDVKHGDMQFDAFGLSWSILKSATGAIFRLQLFGGESQLSLADGATMKAFYTEASPSGEAIAFTVSRFVIGRAGLTVDADIEDQTVPFNGLDAPFRFTSGRLAIEGGQLKEASVAGTGVLPRELVGDAAASVSLRFAQASGGAIRLKDASASLDLGTAPIVCPAIGFTLSLTHIDLDFVDDGGLHFYFALTGSARFTPAPGEFASGLLSNLGSLDINLDKMPLASDARVLARHISFQVEMVPPKDINLFDIFAFEVRSIGFHPSLDAFDGQPAVRIGGQISFTMANDVVNPRIDFHGLMIAPPKPGEVLPQIRCDELSVDLVLEGGIIIGATVAAADSQSSTLDSRTKRPANFKENGFLGAGRLSIPGFAAFSVALGFVEVTVTGRGGGKGFAFLLYAQMNDVAYQIDTPIWPLFIRQFALGMGSNLTPASIAALDRGGTPGQIIATLDQLSRTQNNLADPDVWEVDYVPGKAARVTLVGRLAISFTAASPEDGYDDEEEKELPNPIFFDLVVALRSDLTLFASIRVWIAVNYADFRSASAAITEAPPLRGYLEISAPRHELLARMLNDPLGYIGTHPDYPDVLRSLLRSVKWSALLYMSPNLVQGELGWPDQCSVQLANEPDFRASAKGGLAFRVADGLILFGANFEADATYHFGGSLDLGFAGVSADATLNVGFSARLISCIDTRRPLKSFYYVAFAMHASLDINVSAWLRVDLLFKSFTINISFSVSLQMSAAVELALGGGGIGVHADAKVGIRAFGFTALVPISLSAGNGGMLAEARAMMARFMTMSLTADIPAQDPADQSSATDAATTTDATSADQSRRSVGSPQAVAPTAPVAGSAPPPVNLSVSRGTNIKRAMFGIALTPGTFHLVLRRAEALPPSIAGVPGDYVYAFVVPIDGDVNTGTAFYTPPPAAHGYTMQFTQTGANTVTPVPAIADYFVDFGSPGSALPAGLQRFDPATAAWANTAVATVSSNWADPSFLTPIAHGYLFDAEYNAASPGGPAYYQIVQAQPIAGASAAYWRDPPLRILRTFSAPDTGQPDAPALAAAQRAATAATDFEGPERAAARQARSLVVAQLFEDIETIATTGAPARTLAGNTGLVFLLPKTSIPQLQTMFITRAAGDGKPPDSAKRVLHSPLLLFNPQESFFERGSVALTGLTWEADADAPGAAQGIHLGWKLVAQSPAVQPDPEHFLHHYEIVRGIGNVASLTRTQRVKPVVVAGALDTTSAATNGSCAQTLHPPRWQYTDDLSDLSVAQRAALLGTGSDEDSADILTAWEHLRGGDFAPIYVTYIITPVDTAGTPGDPHALVCTFERPAVPARPAQAVLLLELDHIVAASAGRPANLRLTLGIVDPHWDDAAASANLSRVYQLIAEPEEIVPSGFYGADAQTTRLQSPPTGAMPSAAAVVVELARADFIQASLDPKDRGLPTDFGDAAPAPVWAWIAGQNRHFDVPGNPLLGAGARSDAERLLQGLWQAPSGRRCGVRFSLRTLRRFATKTGTIDVASDAVPVTLEMRVLATGPQGVGFVSAKTLRPSAFEWPVSLNLQPLASAELAGQSGLLQLLAPEPSKGLADFLTSSPWTARRLPDADRRVMTLLRFAAHPAALDDDAAAALAAFDVHALELDTAAAAGNPDLGLDSAAWAAAPRLARVQMIRDEAAMLEPGGLGTLSRWHARYPSNVSRAPDAGGAPVPWFSAAETMPAWPKPRLRDRLLPLPEEAAITSLFAQGTPYALRFALLLPPLPEGVHWPSSALPGFALATIPLHDTGAGKIVSIDTTGLVFAADPVSGRASLPPNGQTASPLQPGDVRRIFLQLAWTVDPAWQATYATTPAMFDGLSLGVTPELAGTAGASQVVIPLDFSVGLHPVLEETLGLLRYARRPADGNATRAVIHLRHAVQAEPPPPVTAADSAAFLAATGAAQDPYGWGVLQSLGLGVSFRMLDQYSGALLRPGDLLARVQATFDGVLANYAARPAGGPLDAGAPFADILLRPGADRHAAPFDEVAAAENSTVLATDVLALVQLSIRPLRGPVAEYWVYDIPPPDTLKPSKGSFVGADQVSVTVKAPTAQTFWPAPIDAVLFYAGRPAGLFAPPAEDRTLTLTMKLPSGAKLVSTGAELNTPVLSIRVRRWAAAAAAPEAPDLVVGLTWCKDGQVSGAQWAGSLTKQIAANGQVAEAAFPSLGVFPPLDATALADQLLNDKPPAPMAAAWNNLGNWLVARAPALALPTDQKPAIALVTLLTGWGKRFIDYGQGTAPAPSPGAAYAIAAPEIAFPWPVAPDPAGWLGVSFLCEARWGRTCAYAVRPLSRWLTLETAMEAAGPGAVPQPPQGRTGYQVTRIRRTQKLAPPSLRLRAQDAASAAQPGLADLIVLRPGEQALAESNRRVAAGLEWQGIARNYALRYLTPGWPAAVASDLGAAPPDAVPATPLLLPPTRPQALGDADLTALAGPAGGALAAAVAAGATVYRHDPTKLPHFYEYAVAVTALAGVTVSPLATVPLGRGRASLPQAAFDARVKTLAITRAPGQGAVVTVTQQLLRHRDCMAAGWGFPPGSIADVPEPDAVYLLSLTDGTVSEDIAELHRAAPAEASPTAFSVRQRGAWFTAMPAAPLTGGFATGDVTAAITLNPPPATPLPQWAELPTAVGTPPIPAALTAAWLTPVEYQTLTLPQGPIPVADATVTAYIASINATLATLATFQPADLLAPSLQKIRTWLAAYTATPVAGAAFSLDRVPWVTGWAPPAGFTLAFANKRGLRVEFAPSDPELAAVRATILATYDAASSTALRDAARRALTGGYTAFHLRAVQYPEPPAAGAPSTPPSAGQAVCDIAWPGGYL